MCEPSAEDLCPEGLIREDMRCVAGTLMREQVCHAQAFAA